MNQHHTDHADCGHSHAACNHEHNHHGERGARLVFWLTMVTMVVEIMAGWAFGSMALLADGWHMASHAGALGVAWFAYVFARRHADNIDFVFGTGKVNALAGFASAVGLVIVAAYMAVESTARLLNPVDIAFGHATLVAVLGLAVNLASAWFLRDADHSHAHDHNLKAAYIHVLADALTSVLAITALLGGRYLGYSWLDPAMGVTGSMIIARWAYGLIRDTAAVLLDRMPSPALAEQARRLLENGSRARVRHIAIWRVGPRRLAATITLEDAEPLPPEDYKARLAVIEELRHITVEIHDMGCTGETASNITENTP